MAILPLILVRIILYTHRMSEWSNFRQMFTLLRNAGMKPAYFIFPGLLSAVAAVFEGISVVLLVPIVQGLFNRDFSFIRQSDRAQQLFSYFPQSWSATDHAILVFILSLFVVAVIFKNVFRYASMLSRCFLAYRTAHHLRKQIFSRYLTFGKFFFDQSTLGHHNTVLTTFTELAMNPLIGLDRYLSQIFSVITYFIIMCSLSWQLTIFSIPLFLILHFTVSIVIKKIRAISAQIATAAKSLQKKSIEILGMIPVVLAHNAQQLEQNRYKKLSDELSASWFRNSIFFNLVNPLNELETLAAMIALFSIILFVIKDTHLTPSSMIVYFYLVMNSAVKFATLTGFRSQIASASGPVSEILKVFDNQEKFTVPGGKKVFVGLKKSIDFRNFHFSYPGSREVLSDISFSVEKTKMTAIVGPTGSGKSTLMSVLMRYYDCDPNMVFVDDADIRDYTLESLRSHMALVSQDTLLFNDTIGNNISYGFANVTKKQILAAVEEASLSDFIEKLPQGLDTIVGDRGVQLSGGEKQRVSIARALLKGADILILDEATSSLDSRTEALIQTAIDRVPKGKTSLVIAHRLSTIKNADTIVVIEHGKCVEQGSLEELLAKKGVFHSYWEAQKFV